MRILSDVLVKPLMTEKVTELTETQNVYGFEVNKKANKRQIKLAIEALFNIKVLKINTMIMPGKVKRAGKTLKKSSSFKKALVKVKTGQKIEFFKGV